MEKLANRFVLEREVGSGGMSRVFLGRDEVLDRPVAVKVLHNRYGGTDLGARFQREGRTAAKLSHPVIVRVYDAGESVFEGHETSYIVMEYVPGGDLKDLVEKRGPLSGARLAEIGATVAAGLAHAHERGVVHRDIKPHNILMDEKGNPRLTDFGIARALNSSQATATGAYLGTALYSSPEQLKGEKVTPKSDVYSLGVTLYEAATGEVPFSGTTIEVATQHVNKEPESLSGRGVDVDEGLEALILASLAKDPDDRPSAEDLRSKLAALKETPAPTKTASAPPPPTREEPVSQSPAPRRSGRRGLVAVLALLAVLAGIGALTIPALLGNDSASIPPLNQPDSGGPSEPANPSNNGDSNADSASGDESNPPEATQDEPDPTEETTRQRPEQTREEPQPSGLTAAAAEQTVQGWYASAASKDYAGFDAQLSESFRQSTFPNQGTFEGTFDTLQSIEFEQGPSAQVSGNTATVTGVTIAEHSDRRERNTGTWSLVQENGEWKINDTSVQTERI